MKQPMLLHALLVVTLVTLLSPTAGFALDRCRVVEMKESRYKNRVLLSGLEYKKIDARVHKRIDSIFKDTLENTKKVKIVEKAEQRSLLREWTGLPAVVLCKEWGCLKEDARRLSADYAVTGTITRVREYRRRKDGYLIYRWYVDTYDIKISFIRIDDGKTLSLVENDKVGPKEINREIQKIAESFSQFIKTKKDYQIACDDIRREFIGGSYEYGLPFGKFRKLTYNCFGLSVNGGLTHYFLENFVLGGEGTFMFFTPDNAAINLFYAMRLNIFAGYQFELPYNLSLMPRAGAGFHLFFIDNVLGERDIYFDSMMILSCTFLYKLNDNWSITFDTGTNVFFEKNNLGNYWFFNFGVRYYL